MRTQVSKLLTALIVTSTITLAPNAFALVSTAQPDRQNQIDRDLPKVKATSPAISHEEDAQPSTAHLNHHKEIMLRDLQIDGLAYYDSEELKPIYEKYLGTMVPVQTIAEIAREITNKYRNDGYILVAAIIPHQDVTKGHVKIKIVESVIDEVKVVGNYKEGSVADGMINNIRNLKPVTLDKLERYILLLNDLPGVSAKIVMKPKETKSEVKHLDLIVVLEEKRFTTVVNVNNNGSRYAGPWQVGVKTGMNHFAAKYNQLELDMIGATNLNELKEYRVNYLMPLSEEGTTAELSYTDVSTKAGYKLSELDVEGYSRGIELVVEHPIIRTRNMNWSVGMDFDIKRSRTTILDSLLYRDKLTVLELYTAFNNSDKYGQNMAQFQISRGLDIFGARDTGSSFLSRQFGHSDFTKLNATMGRVQTLPWDFAMYIAATGQYSFSSLLVSQQFGFGGREFGRGYDYSELLGDRGAAGVAELRYDGIPQYWGVSSEAFASYDLGHVWQRHKTAPKDDPFGSSAAIGYRFNHADDFYGYVMMAKPLTHKAQAPVDGNGKSLRFFGYLNLYF